MPVVGVEEMVGVELPGVPVVDIVGVAVPEVEDVVTVDAAEVAVVVGAATNNNRQR